MVVTVLLIILGVCAPLVSLLFLPIKMHRPPRDAVPAQRIDERDTMFSRNELSPESKRFDEYYRGRPELLDTDRQLRKLPGLLSSEARETDPLTSASTRASFAVVSTLQSLVEGQPAPHRKALTPADGARYIKCWAKYLGARSVGITLLRDYHLYSVMGRGDRYGVPVESSHTHAVALTVEMEYEAVQRGPKGPTVMESARQYLASGAIAVQIAVLIRQLGYTARPHIDGNYQVVCPLVARDAGLGEIGRMGLLMTPDLGPRVRIAVVTTDLPLEVDERLYDPTVIDFCNRCEKCAVNCPSAAIPKGERREYGGSYRWQINQERCFSYWKTAGTDCGRCMAVCPYSHPNTPVHRFVRRLIRRNQYFRHLAVKADDLIYRRKPSSAQPSSWQLVRPAR